MMEVLMDLFGALELAIAVALITLTLTILPDITRTRYFWFIILILFWFIVEKSVFGFFWLRGLESDRSLVIVITILIIPKVCIIIAVFLWTYIRLKDRVNGDHGEGYRQHNGDE